MSTLQSRLRHARTVAGKTQAEVSSAVGMSQPSYSELETTDGANSTYLPKIARFLGVDLDWLLDGTGERPSPTVTVLPAIPGARRIRTPLVRSANATYPQLRAVEIAKGQGGPCVTFPLRKQESFLSEWLADRKFTIETVATMAASGDSMAPWICNQDSLLIDTDRVAPLDGQAYAIRYGDEVRVRYVYARFDGSLLLRCENSARYPDEVISPENMPHIEIIGRVVWRGG